ncbi:MAG: hypothetical protein ACOYOK_01690 [Pseudobdellovibrionaceae bacterium]
MSAAKTDGTNKKEILRVALDAKATQSYESIEQRLKDYNPTVRFYPSELVSFIVSDFFETYFENDIDILVAAFFDSHGFVNIETQKAKNKANFEEVLREALSTAEKIKSKVRRKSKIKGMRDQIKLNDKPEHEKV